MKATNLTTRSALQRHALAAATALVLALGATTAAAQPAGPMPGGPGLHAHGAAMHGGPGMHGGGMEMMLPRALEQAKASLNLSPQQQTDWDAAVAAGKAARTAAQANRTRVRDALAAELAKADPKLAAVAAIADTVRQQNQDARKTVRNQWLALYGTFTLEQKAIVRDLMKQRLARAEAFHQGMPERMRDRSGATTN